MNGPRAVAVFVVAVAGLFAAGLAVTFLSKLRFAADRTTQESDRLPRSMSVDQSLPDWSRNLDRDTDGAVTRVEFVGTDEAFAVIDTDRSGAVSPAAVRAADEWFRRQIPNELPAGGRYQPSGREFEPAALLPMDESGVPLHARLVRHVHPNSNTVFLGGKPISQRAVVDGSWHRDEPHVMRGNGRCATGCTRTRS